jgi:hypothetical protein
VDGIPGPNSNVENADPVIESLGEEVDALDTHKGGHTGITESYLIRGSGPCLRQRAPP